MKMLNLCVALVFTVSVCFVAIADTSFAASKEVSKKVEKTKKSAKSKAKSTKSKAKSTKSKVKNTKKTTKSKVKKVTKPININTADKKMLSQLPGVGPKTADAILKHRKANGKFKSANDLLNVKGIGKKTLMKLKPLLKF